MLLPSSTTILVALLFSISVSFKLSNAFGTTTTTTTTTRSPLPLPSNSFIPPRSASFSVASVVGSGSRSRSRNPLLARGRIKRAISLFRSSSNDDNVNDETQRHPLNKRPQHLSASQKERRNEDDRRKDRLQEGFATPGLSSAVPGARDYPIDVARTEEEYLRSLGGDVVDGDDNSCDDGDVEVDEANVDRYAAAWTEEGLAHLRMMRFAEASASFSNVYRIKPEAYLWQDGLLKYYAGDHRGAARSLAENAKRYESRFWGESASEERIWRDAAELRVVNSPGRRKDGRRRRRRSVKDDDDNDDDVVARVPVGEGEDEERVEKENIANERRKVFRLARQLFSSSLRDNPAGVALARAQLQALCGDSFPSSLKSTLPTMPSDDDDGDESKPRSSSSSAFKARPDRKMYRLHSLFYLGLHFDALGQSYESKQCMKMALRTCSEGIGGNNSDITYLLPVIHMTIRDWYDDDEFDEVEEDGEGSTTTTDEEDEDGIVARLVSQGGVELAIADVDDDGEETKKKRDENEEATTTTTKTTTTKGSDSEGVGGKEEKRLREGIKHMRIVDLKGELKKRKLRVSGSKKTLQDRLVDDLRRSGKDGSGGS